MTYSQGLDLIAMVEYAEAETRTLINKHHLLMKDGKNIYLEKQKWRIHVLFNH